MSGCRGIHLPMKGLVLDSLERSRAREKFMHSMEEKYARAPWWEEGLYFSCLGCGKCCRDEPGAVWVTQEEQEAIAASLKITDEEFRRTYLWECGGRPSIRERANYDCFFLNRNPDRCGIYNVRPAQCRLFPFWPSVLKSKLSWDRYSLSCQGMNQGDFYDSARIRQLLSLSPWVNL